MGAESKFTIYDADSVSVLGRELPGRLAVGFVEFNGTWDEGTNWLKEQQRTLPVGRYICIATSVHTSMPSGVWAFTREAPKAPEPILKGGV